MKKGFQIFCLFFCMMLTGYSPGNSRQRIPKEMEWIKDDITYDGNVGGSRKRSEKVIYVE